MHRKWFEQNSKIGKAQGLLIEITFGLREVKVFMRNHDKKRL